MEGLSLSEQRSPLGWPPQRAPRRYRSPRLPTPEASRSSNEALEIPSSIEVSHRGPPMREPLLRTSPQRGHGLLPQNSNDGELGRYNGRSQSIPHSPPYRAMGLQKPSLPPLKIVLGNNISSPPQTPTAFGGSCQPFPCEPTYTAATYKPPSLYPNKKQRTGPFQVAAPPDPNASSFSSPRLPPSSLEAGLQGASRPHNNTYPPVSLRPEMPQQRRGSVQYSPSAPYAYHTSTAPNSEDNGGRRGVHRPYKMPEQKATVMAYDLSYHPSHAPYAPTPSNRLSIDVRADHAGRAVESHYVGPSPCEPGTRSHLSPRLELEARTVEGRRPEEPQRHAPPGSVHGPYEPSQPSFFMRSHYEYQHGKARKRSNLPKQSTEIMKTWFDQNIVNPYPSEEQKALFSNATGISMTQVSNWFINHRRRCPEMRTKRENGRGNGIDGDI